MTCSTCGFEGHNSRTCKGAHWECPTCGKPTANMNSYEERFDPAFCSPRTTPGCWGTPTLVQQREEFLSNKEEL